MKAQPQEVVGFLLRSEPAIQSWWLPLLHLTTRELLSLRGLSLAHSQAESRFLFPFSYSYYYVSTLSRCWGKLLWQMFLQNLESWLNICFLLVMLCSLGKPVSRSHSKTESSLCMGWAVKRVSDMGAEGLSTARKETMVMWGGIRPVLGSLHIMFFCPLVRYWFLSLRY